LMYLFVFSSCYLDVSSPHLLLGNIASFWLLSYAFSLFWIPWTVPHIGVNMRVEERRKSIQGKKGWFFI
jgi:hypothetical protein